MNDIIKEWIETSLRDLFTSNDLELINRELKEECINHRLAFYLEKNKPPQYSHYYIDLEYNKNAAYEKSIDINGITKFIRPDILVHKRTDDIHDNLIAFECKKRYLNANDKEKLISLLGNGYNYQVCLGVSYQPLKEYFLIYKQNNLFRKPIQIKKTLCTI